jgi:hypothetical protein
LAWRASAPSPANILRRGSAYALLLNGYAALVALLISYPLWWLQSDPTLTATSR